MHAVNAARCLIFAVSRVAFRHPGKGGQGDTLRDVLGARNQSAAPSGSTISTSRDERPSTSWATALHGLALRVRAVIGLAVTDQG